MRMSNECFGSDLILAYGMTKGFSKPVVSGFHPTANLQQMLGAQLQTEAKCKPTPILRSSSVQGPQLVWVISLKSTSKQERLNVVNVYLLIFSVMTDNLALVPYILVLIAIYLQDSKTSVRRYQPITLLVLFRKVSIHSTSSLRITWILVMTQRSPKY